MKRKNLRIFAVLLALCLLAGCATAIAESYTYADTIAWDGQYDVIVAGFGGAGAMAAKNAADAGATVLVVEKAPLGSEGGNTRFCGQVFAFGHHDYESTYKYYKALAGAHSVPDAMLETYASKVAVMDDFVAEQLGLDKNDFMDGKEVPLLAAAICPEYPELPGSDAIGVLTIHHAWSDAALWNVMRQNVVDRSDKIDVWFDSPAVHLIQDPATKTILGVQVQRDGQILNMRANNGVVLATGGFENNEQMVQDYLGLDVAMPVGTFYNTGDGIRMAMEVGADLWHMDVYEGSTWAVVTIAKEGEHSVTVLNAALRSGSAVIVGADGTRFIKEDFQSRHGHYNHGGVYLNPRIPAASYSIVDADNYALALEKGLPADYAYTYRGETLEELAQAAGINPENLVNTINSFNTYAETGIDPEQRRAAESMAAFGEGPYYALKLQPGILNTQGGPRRNENAEVLDVNGKPIPHLYSAGELGGLCSLQYNGGSNIAECMIFGSIAGTNAAAPKEALPAYTAPVPVESKMTYTHGTVNDILASATEGIEATENEILGEGHGLGGALVVKVTFDGDTIAAVEVVSHSETLGKADRALEKIPGMIVEAQSTEIDNISGATMTSKAIKEAVADALSKR